MKQKQEQLKQIKIDLEKDCISPPKALVDVYEKENANDIWIDKDLKPEYRNNLRIHAASKGSGNKIVKKIFTLYRKRLTNGTEWLIFHISISCKDHWGNNLSMPLLLGFVDLPQISRTYAFNPHTRSTTGANGYLAILECFYWIMMDLAKMLAKELDLPEAAHSTRFGSEVCWGEIPGGR